MYDVIVCMVPVYDVFVYICVLGMIHIIYTLYFCMIYVNVCMRYIYMMHVYVVYVCIIRVC